MLKIKDGLKREKEIEVLRAENQQLRNKLDIVEELLTIEYIKSDKDGYDFEVIKVGDVEVKKTYIEQSKKVNEVQL